MIVLDEQQRKYDDVLTVKELMDFLAIGKNTAYELLKSGKIKSGKKIWYTKDFRYKNNLMWKRKVAYIKNKDLMAYELCGNTFYFANRKGIKNCIKKTMKTYVQLLQQMERRENSFTTFLWIDEIDYFVTDFKWTTEIRFYENREKSKNAEIMGKNINDIEVPIMLIYA